MSKELRCKIVEMPDDMKGVTETIDLLNNGAGYHIIVIPPKNSFDKLKIVEDLEDTTFNTLRDLTIGRAFVLEFLNKYQ